MIELDYLIHMFAHLRHSAGNAKNQAYIRYAGLTNHILALCRHLYLLGIGMARCVVKNGHQKDTCYDEIGNV